MASMVSVLHIVNYFTILICICLGIYMAIEDKGLHIRLKIVEVQGLLKYPPRIYSILTIETKCCEEVMLIVIFHLISFCISGVH